MIPDEIAEHFDCSRQAVLKQIRILTEGKLPEQRQDGQEIYYHVNSIKMMEIDNWLEQFRVVYESRFNPLDIIFKANKIKNK